MNHSLSHLPQKKIWKYAQTELERRFLLSGEPSLPSDINVKTIEDTYLHQTRIRLRKATNENGSIYKLTKKLLLKEAEIDKQWISTIYLSESEYLAFQILPGNFLRKKRYSLSLENYPTIGIDEIELKTQKIWIAEVEFESEAEMKQFAFPLDFEKEVTHDSAYAGNTLAERYQKNYQ